MTTRGQRGVATLAVPAIPSTTVTVSRTSATTPVARVAYHSGLGPAVPAASAPVMPGRLVVRRCRAARCRPAQRRS